MKNRVLKEWIVIFGLCGCLGISALAEERDALVLDNAGVDLENVYGDCGLVESYTGLNYYDCYIPYNLTIEDIGGYACDSDDFIGMPDEVRNYNVGEVVGNFEGGLDLDYKYDDNDVRVYKDSYNNEYYGVMLPRFFYNQSGDSYEFSNTDVSGQLADAILADGTVIHLIVEGVQFDSKSNGWLGDTSLDSGNPHTETNIPIYMYLFDDMDGFTIDVDGLDGCGDKFASEYGLNKDGSRLSYIRMYNGKVQDISDSRESKLVSEKYDIDLSKYDSMPKEPSWELGKENSDLVKSKFSDETQKIVEDHCLDFDVSNFKSYLSEKGGYVEYIKSLGGVFEKFAGDGTKIPVKTAGDYQIACEYVYGIICMWGFDYSNGDTSHYGRWKAGVGNASDAFYPRSYAIPYEYKRYPAKPRNIDKIAAQENVTREGVNTCCNYCVDLIRNKIELADVLTKDNGKQPSTCDVATQRKMMEKAYGFNGIFKVTDLKVGDLIHCFGHPLTSSEKENCVKPSGWGHVKVVGEIDKEAGTITCYETGHDLTNDGNFKTTYKFKDGTNIAGYSGWIGTRWFNIDGSTDTSDANNSASDSDSSFRNALQDKLVPEDQLKGMPKSDLLKDSAESVSLPDGNELSGKEKVDVNMIKESIKLQKENIIVNTIRTFVMFIGLCLLAYIIFLYVACAFDMSNIFFDIGLLSIITLGCISIKDLYIKDRYSLGRIHKISACLFAVSIILISGSLYNFISVLVRMVGA